MYSSIAFLTHSSDINKWDPEHNLIKHLFCGVNISTFVNKIAVNIDLQQYFQLVFYYQLELTK